MTDIIEFIIILLILWALFGIGTRIYKRIYLIRIMRKISKLEGVSVKRIAFPFLSLLHVLRAPEYIVNIYDTAYLVRVYNGGGVTSAVHFASEKFTVCYSRFKTVTYAPKRGRYFSVKGFNFGGKVRVVQPIEIPPELQGREFTEVMIFNPAPGEVSYVVKEKTSIKVAFTGDAVYGRKIFTASTFEIFVDREARRIRDVRKGEYYDPWKTIYNS